MNEICSPIWSPIIVHLYIHENKYTEHLTPPLSVRVRFFTFLTLLMVKQIKFIIIFLLFVCQYLTNLLFNGIKHVIRQNTKRCDVK